MDRGLWLTRRRYTPTVACVASTSLTDCTRRTSFPRTSVSVSQSATRRSRSPAPRRTVRAPALGFPPFCTIANWSMSTWLLVYYESCFFTVVLIICVFLLVRGWLVTSLISCKCETLLTDLRLYKSWYGHRNFYSRPTYRVHTYSVHAHV